MPRGDRTGPEGFGPMTGRGMGFCAGNATAGFYAGGRGRCFGRGRGFGFGRGLGFGWGRTGVVPPVEDAETRKVLLDDEIELIERRLAALKKQRDAEADE